MILSPYVFGCHPTISAAEVAAPGVKNTGGTMEWLSGLRGLHPMQFFHTLWPVCLLSAGLVHLAVMGHARMCWSGLSRGGRPLHGAEEIAGPTSSSWRTQPHAFHTHHQAGLVIPTLSSPSSPLPPTSSSPGDGIMVGKGEEWGYWGGWGQGGR